MMSWRSLCLVPVILFTCLLFFTMPLYALSGMVIRVEGEKIVLNRGTKDSMTPGQELYVHRIGKPVAKIRVTLVDSYSSVAQVSKLETDEAVRVGDVVSTEPFSVPYTPPPPSPKETTSGSQGTIKPSKSSQDASDTYLRLLKDQTKIATFKSGPKGQVRVGIGEVSMLLNALTWTSSAVPYTYGDPWMLVTIGSSLVNQYQTSRKVAPQSGVHVAVTYYSDALIDAQARYFASKEGITDEEQIKELKQGLIQQMGTDVNMVFHIKISNQGSTVLQLAPFKWHMYVVNGSGKKVSATRYEEGLDKGIGNQQEAQGYVYFPKTDESGMPNTSGSLVRVTLEAFLGGSTDIIWK